MQAGDNIYRNEVIRIAELAGDIGGLEGFVFVGCDIKGPAILVPQATNLVGNSFMGEPDAWLWEIPPGRQNVIGAVLVRECVFEDCTFINVGLAGTPDFIRQLKEGFGHE